MASRRWLQLPRHLLQGGFLLFFLWIGWRFAHWVTALQGGQPAPFPRPAAVDGFLPISGLMGLRYWAHSGELFPVHPAAALIVLAALLTALLLKRGFCSWICPVYTLGEGLWHLGRKLFGRNFVLPLWLDLPLRSLKYLLLAFFLWSVFLAMPLPALQGFLGGVYHRIVDVRMLGFFLNPSTFLLGFLVLFVLLSLFVQLPWCRYLCPYGALLGLISIASFGKIRREEKACVHCGACSARCPAWLPVRFKTTVRSPECYACYRCVAGCPAPGALNFVLPRRLVVVPAVFALLLLVLFVGLDLYGRSIDRWGTPEADRQVGEILQRQENAR